MSIAQIPTEPDEAAVLLMARAGGRDGYDLTDLTHEALIRKTALGLARQGLVTIKGSRIFLTREGFAYSVGEAA